MLLDLSCLGFNILLRPEWYVAHYVVSSWKSFSPDYVDLTIEILPSFKNCTFTSIKCIRVTYRVIIQRSWYFIPKKPHDGSSKVDGLETGFDRQRSHKSFNTVHHDDVVISTSSCSSAEMSEREEHLKRHLPPLPYVCKFPQGLVTCFEIFGK